MRAGLLVLWCAVVCGQDFSQRGFLDVRTVIYPQHGSNDSGHVVSDALLRYEASKGVVQGLRVYGAFDVRTDTHRQTERELRVDWSDRRLQRPAFSVRRLSALYNRGKFSVEVGKQFVRWGKADILNPTDRFAPRDFLSVLDNDLLSITAARAVYEGSSTTVEAIWQPRFTPSRTPLVNQRWTVIPPGLRIVDTGSRIPGGSQFGVRVNHLGHGYEASACYYEGHNHLPILGAALIDTTTVQLERIYPNLRFWGADSAVPLRWFTVKGEAGWFVSSRKQSDDYVLYVIQLERQIGEWSVVAGYAGEGVTKRRNLLSFAADRGFADAFLGRAGYTIDANRSIAFEAAVRQNGDGTWLRFEYSHLFGQHWRATTAVTLIRGALTDFIGQYRLNSNAVIAFRYSF